MAFAQYPTPAEIRENLNDAGCTPREIGEIMTCLANEDFAGMQEKISSCRKKQLQAMHESQKCIDRLDYLCYRLKTETQQ